MNDPSWFESWFNSPYYHLLYRDRDESEARPFMERLTRYLQLTPGARILDLACGKGRHSIPLADLGFDVHGVDIAPENISYASQFSRPGLSFDVHDMREPLTQGPFDAVLNLFTSFGYFETDQEHQQALRVMVQALKPDGQLVIDYLNAAQATGQLVPAETRLLDNITFHLERKRTPQHLIKEIRVIDPAATGPHLFAEKVAAFRLHDFEHMLGLEGMRIVDAFGEYDLTPFDAQRSSRLILVAKSR